MLARYSAEVRPSTTRRRFRADAAFEARRHDNNVIPLAEGEKDQRIRKTDGYRLKRIKEAEGDVARFSALLTECNKALESRR